MKSSLPGGVVLVCALAFATQASAQAPWEIQVWMGDPNGAA
jgi:hypothetical protein